MIFRCKCALCSLRILLLCCNFGFRDFQNLIGWRCCESGTEERTESCGRPGAADNSVSNLKFYSFLSDFCVEDKQIVWVNYENVVWLDELSDALLASIE